MLVVAATVTAQDCPSRPIRMVVAVAPEEVRQGARPGPIMDAMVDAPIRPSRRRMSLQYFSKL